MQYDSKLVDCKVCEGKMSSNAERCPHCGEPNPDKQIEDKEGGCFFGCILPIIATCAIAWVVWQLVSLI